jgi:hypothetical protein
MIANGLDYRNGDLMFKAVQDIEFTGKIMWFQEFYVEAVSSPPSLDI